MWRLGWLGGSFRPLAYGFNRLGRFAPDPAIPYSALEKANWQNHSLTGVAGEVIPQAMAAALTQAQALTGGAGEVLIVIGFGPITQTQQLSPQPSALPTYAYPALVTAATFLFPYPNAPGVLLITPDWGIAVVTPHYTILLGD